MLDRVTYKDAEGWSAEVAREGHGLTLTIESPHRARFLMMCPEGVELSAECAREQLEGYKAVLKATPGMKGVSE